MFLDYILNILPDRFARSLAKFFLGKVDYCFLVHSRDYHDLKIRFPLFRLLPLVVLKFVGRYMFPIRAGKISGLESRGKKFKGFFIGSPMDAADMLRNRELARKKIIRAVRFCSKIGAEYVGLGALSASLTQNGTSIPKFKNLNLTTGHSLTAWTVANNAIHIKELVPDKRFVVGIVGAGGSIGSTTYNLLRGHFDKFILIDKDIDRTRKKVTQDGKVMYLGSSIEKVKDCNLIITATNAPYAIIKDSSYLSSGTIVIDDAQPINASKQVNNEKKNTLVIEGGVVHLRGISYKLKLGMLDRGDMFSCMGELLTITKLESKEVTIGDTTVNQVKKIGDLAAEAGIHIARFRSFGKPVSNKRIKEILG